MMNKIARRLVAGILTAALFVLSVGSDAFTEYGKETITIDSAVSTGKAVNFIHPFSSPALPSAGSSGIDFTITYGVMLAAAGGIWLVLLSRKARSRDKPEG